MQLGMVGLGRMGANMVRRLMEGGHECVVFDKNPQTRDAMAGEGAIAAASPQQMVDRLAGPRCIWMMVPAGVVEDTVSAFSPLLASGDILVDGGNSYYKDDMARSKALEQDGIRYLDVGTSGGVWGRDRGYCMMIGGDAGAVEHLDPVLKTLSPSVDSAPRTPGRENAGGTAEHGYLHCGPSGAGHFVKMVHNGIEYGVMASYAEGLNILRHAGVGRNGRTVDAETAPLRNPEDYQFDLNLADITEVWRRGSVIASWLLDLTAEALLKDPHLDSFTGRVSDSGEGRWTINAAIDESVPTPVLSSALFQRFSSRDQAEFADKVCSAMRKEFGGHVERAAGG